MSEPWIKVRTNLARNPKVVRVRRTLNVHVREVVGACIMLWSLADEHAHGDTLRGYQYADVDEMVGLPGFCAAAEPVGWCAQTPEGVKLPGYGRHNGPTAKRRAARAKSEAANRHKRGQSVDNEGHEKATTRPPSKEQSRASKEQAESKTMLKSIALPEFNLGDDACSLLQAIGMDPEAIRFLTTKPGVDDGQVYWACERTREAMVKARQGTGKRITNPAGYCRDLIERKRPPQGWRDEWNRKRLAAQAARLPGLKIAGGAA